MTEFPDWVLNTMPQPLFAVAMFSLLALAAVIGRLARNYRAKKPGSPQLESTKEGYVVSAVLGLLALLMGFTFSMAVERYDNRRALVMSEANAIASSYLMAQTFAEPHRGRVSSILVSYIDNRLILAREQDPQRIAALLDETHAMQANLWASSLAATSGLRDDIASNYLDKTTEAIEAGERRVTARQSHIPNRVYMVLLVYMFIAAAVMGFAFSNSPQVVTSGTLFVLLTISMVLIIDLDRPTTGAIIESQQAMENLQIRLSKITPSALDSQARPPPPSLRR